MATSDKYAQQLERLAERVSRQLDGRGCVICGRTLPAKDHIELRCDCLVHERCLGCVMLGGGSKCPRCHITFHDSPGTHVNNDVNSGKGKTPSTKDRHAIRQQVAKSASQKWCNQCQFCGLPYFQPNNVTPRCKCGQERRPGPFPPAGWHPVE